MSRPRFLADEDLRYEIVLALMRLEPAVDIVTVQDAGRSGALDSEVLDFAQRQGRLLVSHDVNTLRGEAQQRIADGRGVFGVFLSSQHRRTRDIAETLLAIWGASEAEEWRDRIVFIPF